MTNKKYRCKNGDLIEVGKEYSFLDGGTVYKAEVLKILPSNKVVSYLVDSNGLGIADVDYKGSFQSLWQEQPDADGWIKHTTGKQPVADDVRVEVRAKEVLEAGRAGDYFWEDFQDKTITHYRIVEDKQESETLMDYVYLEASDINSFSPKAVCEIISEYLQNKGI